ncbi:hypothetical protein GOODEAATRI_002764 [Goodea atripinnis]|uniref:Secreted protein n=1 Tax=Goodea atripinnis TaxID=208336 RepID=A0ABV0P156_9TELE
MGIPVGILLLTGSCHKTVSFSLCSVHVLVSSHGWPNTCHISTFLTKVVFRLSKLGFSSCCVSSSHACTSLPDSGLYISCDKICDFLPVDGTTNRQSQIFPGLKSLWALDRKLLT